MKREQRLHREADPRVRRSLARVLLVSALIVAGALVVVGARLQQVHLAYELDALRAERGRLETRVRQLDVEVATLRAPGRVEVEARRQGLIAPGPDQVRLAREYVAGGAGMAAARLARTPEPPSPPSPEALVR